MNSAVNGPRFSPMQKAVGLVVASLVGWLLITSQALGWPFVELSVANTFFGKDADLPSWGQTARWMYLYAILGLPIALIVCFAVGWPMWILAEKKVFRSLSDAAELGARVGFIIGAGGIVLGFLLGLQITLDDQWSFDRFRWGYQVTRDGLPTLLGLALQLLGLLWTALVGAASGFFARLAVGAPRNPA